MTTIDRGILTPKFKCHLGCWHAMTKRHTMRVRGTRIWVSIGFAHLPYSLARVVCRTASTIGRYGAASSSTSTVVVSDSRTLFFSRNYRCRGRIRQYRLCRRARSQVVGVGLRCDRSSGGGGGSVDGRSLRLLRAKTLAREGLHRKLTRFDSREALKWTIEDRVVLQGSSTGTGGEDLRVPVP